MPAADVAADPNPITDPTGGQKNFNILDVFESFGYYPTLAEFNALSSSFSGTYDPGRIGTSAVGQYVNYKQQMDQFEKTDPLNALRDRFNNIIDQNTKSVQGLYSQLQDTISAAPQLFGSLTPDQISTYLGPLKTAFDASISAVQGVMASRGLGASSTEANALAQTAQQFQQNVLQTGLNIGLTSQQQKEQAIQSQINNLFGQTGQALSGAQAVGSQQSQQNLGISNLFASLPSFLNAQSAQEEQLATATEKANHPGFQGTFNQVTSDIGQAVNTVGQAVAAYYTFGGSSVLQNLLGKGPKPYSAPTPAPYNPATFQPPSLNIGGNYDPNASRYANTGTVFEG